MTFYLYRVDNDQRPSVGTMQAPDLLISLGPWDMLDFSFIGFKRVIEYFSEGFGGHPRNQVTGCSWS